MLRGVGFRIPVRHPLVAWMIPHAANLVTWCARGHDGQTAYQRVRHREFTTRLLGFGETCSFRIRAHEPIANSMGARRFNKGVFVGIDRRTGQNVLHADDGIKLSRTLMRMPDDQKFDKSALSSVAATPWNIFEARTPEVIFKEKAPERPRED